MSKCPLSNNNCIDKICELWNLNENECFIKTFLKSKSKVSTNSTNRMPFTGPPPVINSGKKKEKRRWI